MNSVNSPLTHCLLTILNDFNVMQTSINTCIMDNSTMEWCYMKQPNSVWLCLSGTLSPINDLFHCKTWIKSVQLTTMTASYYGHKKVNSFSGHMGPLGSTNLHFCSPQPDISFTLRDHRHGASALCGVYFPAKAGPHLPTEIIHLV